MELELRFFATFREAAGGKIVEAEFADGSSVGDVLRELEAGYEGMNGRLIVDGGLAPQINVLKNGREVLHLDGLDTSLDDGDRLSVFPPCRGRVRSMSDAGDGNDGSVDGASETQPPAEAGWEREEVAYRGSRDDSRPTTSSISAANSSGPTTPRRRPAWTATGGESGSAPRR